MLSSLIVVILIFTLLLNSNAQNLEKSRSVWVEQGLIRGKIYKIGDNYMQIFRGIPYAEPPIGKLRFRVRCFSSFSFFQLYDFYEIVRKRCFKYAILKLFHCYK
uniref:Carboxylesterase type B domain-containing protein n=1 Tax=Parascaris equorum TaxID=6256 RepID=A0A914S762_PAREQ